MERSSWMTSGLRILLGLIIWCSRYSSVTFSYKIRHCYSFDYFSWLYTCSIRIYHPWWGCDQDSNILRTSWTHQHVSMSATTEIRHNSQNVHELQGITLKLTPGSKVALVGPSGGGKVIYIVHGLILPVYRDNRCRICIFLITLYYEQPFLCPSHVCCRLPSQI